MDAYRGIDDRAPFGPLWSTRQPYGWHFEGRCLPVLAIRSQARRADAVGRLAPFDYAGETQLAMENCHRAGLTETPNIGAGDRTRTGTRLLVTDFKSVVSTNFTTPAKAKAARRRRHANLTRIFTLARAASACPLLIRSR